MLKYAPVCLLRYLNDLAHFPILYAEWELLILLLLQEQQTNSRLFIFGRLLENKLERI